MSANEKQVGGSHYKDKPVQPWDVIDTWPLEQRIGAYRAGALKYVMRLGDKDASLQEIKKAAHYCEKLAEVLAQAEQVNPSWSSPSDSRPKCFGNYVEPDKRDKHSPPCSHCCSQSDCKQQAG